VVSADLRRFAAALHIAHGSWGSSTGGCLHAGSYAHESGASGPGSLEHTMTTSPVESAEAKVLAANFALELDTERRGHSEFII